MRDGDNDYMIDPNQRVPDASPTEDLPISYDGDGVAIQQSDMSGWVTDVAAPGAITPDGMTPQFPMQQQQPGYASFASAPVGQSEPGMELFDRLVASGRLTADQLEIARFEHVKSGRSLRDVLVDQGFITDEDLRRFQAESAGIPYISLDSTAVSTEALSLVPQSVAERFEVLAFDYNKDLNQLSVAMVDPMNLDAVEFLQKKTRSQLLLHMASRDQITKFIKERYDVNLTSEVKAVLKDTDVAPSRAEVEATKMTDDVIRAAPISKIVSYVMEFALKMRASDVHIEPQEDKTRVRYRIDGILQEKLVLPKTVHDSLVSRIKILSDLKIDERRLPQDGRFNFKSTDQEVDLRVSTLPTVHGEKVVMRLLRKSGGAATLQELGLRGRALKNLEDAIVKPHGIILVTGPTGSGKTTTLYSVLTKLNTPKVNIMTLEDPVEYQMSGINQVQINSGIGLTFASGLRSFLRQDPNVIMVGEIRDSETAELAIQASLTGHLVLSTLHTNSSAGALPRLLDMGAETFLLASSMIAVVAQRVVRKICTNCKQEYVPEQPAIDTLKKVLGTLYPASGIQKLCKGAGCAECGMSGYMGRMAIYEVLPISEKIARMILERQSAVDIEKMAITEGMVTIKQDGYLKVIEGLTTVEEVLRVAET